ncbi:MAG: hypothetical protein OEZ58_16680 [Gammaproteobacteria bacterium]|nr:hypothetical protein [Gammaproteobacteria bacterium]
MKILNRNSLLFVVISLFASPITMASKPHTDVRTLIQIDSQAKEHVLLEMRQLLEATQLILDSALKNDMKAVSQYASNVGLKAMKATPTNVASQLPKEFKIMGRSVHEAMDSIARDANDLGDREHTLTQLNETLQSCVACHNVFKFQ